MPQMLVKLVDNLLPLPMSTERCAYCIEKVLKVFFILAAILYSDCNTNFRNGFAALDTPIHIGIR